MNIDFTQEKLFELIDAISERQEQFGGDWYDEGIFVGLKDPKEIMASIIFGKKKRKDFPMLTLKQWQSLNGKACALLSKINVFCGINNAINSYKSKIKKTENKVEALKDFPDKRYLAYDEYLESDYWKAIRKKALDRDGGRCKLCNELKNLQVHHRSYKNKWGDDAEFDDLVTLCEECHKNFHNFYTNELLS